MIALAATFTLLTPSHEARDPWDQESLRRVAAEDPVAVMGDYEGYSSMNDGTEAPLAAQVVAMGNGEYRARVSRVFGEWEELGAILDGEEKDDAVVFGGIIEQGEYTGLELTGSIRQEQFSGSLKSGSGEAGVFQMEKVKRLSATLGAKTSEEAITLFDGTDFLEWEQLPSSRGLLNRILNNLRKKRVQWRLVDGAMEVKPGSGSIVTRRKFTDFRLHVEFRTPFMPEARGQDRGNSGVYLQGRYEIQVLDSYGLEGRDNECGGIYKVANPRINMCAPPLQWQTYDISFRSPRFDSNKKKIRSATVTVLHNGVEIHKDVEVDFPTGGEVDSDISQAGGIFFQDHGNRVRYRNVWLEEIGE